MQLHSIELERYALAGLCKHSSIYPQVHNFHCEKDYYNDTHKTIFSVIKSFYDNAEKLDRVTLGTKIKNLGIKVSDDLDVFEYIDVLFSTQITNKGALDAIAELSKLRIKRELSQKAKEIEREVANDSNESIDHLIRRIDSIYNDQINLYRGEDEPEDIFEGLIEDIESRANNPTEELGLKIPYQRFQNLYGGLTPGNIYAFISRLGAGKSTLLNDLAFKATYLNPNCRVLILDTEMHKYEVGYRLAGAITGINPWYLATGMFNKNKELRKIWEDKKKEVEKAQKRIDHRQVTEKPIDEIVSIAKRWKYQRVGRNNPAVIVYDYLKVTGEGDGNKAEYQLLGDKINKLKELATNLEVPILTANQQNRSLSDDSTSSSQSDRIGWIASYLGLFRKKTEDEIAEEGSEYGTHKLITLKARHQGKDAAGHNDFVKVPNNDPKSKSRYKYKQNFISFNVDNFNIEERATLTEIINQKNEEYDVGEEIVDSNDGL